MLSSASSLLGTNVAWISHNCCSPYERKSAWKRKNRNQVIATPVTGKYTQLRDEKLAISLFAEGKPYCIIFFCRKSEGEILFLLLILLHLSLNLFHAWVTEHVLFIQIAQALTHNIHIFFLSVICPINPNSFFLTSGLLSISRRNDMFLSIDVITPLQTSQIPSWQDNQHLVSMAKRGVMSQSSRFNTVSVPLSPM